MVWYGMVVALMTELSGAVSSGSTAKMEENGGGCMKCNLNGQDSLEFCILQRSCGVYRVLQEAIYRVYI